MPFTGIVCAVFAATSTLADTTNWTDAEPNNPNWDEDDNWSNNAPDDTVDATHLTSASDIRVNVSSAECLSFEGKGGSTDRFLELDAGEAWTVGSGGLFFSSGIGSGFFVVKYDNGSSGDLTSISVDGDVTGITFVPTTGIGLRGQYINLAVGGDVINTSLTVSDHCVIDIDGSVDGGTRDWSVGDDATVNIDGGFKNVDVTWGSSGGTDMGSIILGAVGDVNDPIDDTWTVRGTAHVDCNGDFQAGTSTILIEDDGKINVDGDAVEGDWTLRDNAQLRATSTDENIIGQATVLVQDFGKVDVYRIRLGDWTVEDDGRVLCAGHAEPSTLVVDSGYLSAVKGIGTTIWDLTLKNGAIVEGLGEDFENAWHRGTGDGQGDNSTITYEGVSNVYNVLRMHLGGELIRTGPADLTLDLAGDLDIPAELVRIDGSATETISFDTEGVALEMTEDTCTTAPTLEVFSPDYKDGATDYNPDNVLFTDSPCVRRWGELVIKDNSSSNCVELGDSENSTPISGPGAGWAEALHVTDLTIESGAELDAGSLRIYHVNSITNNGTLTGTTVQVSLTTYGDFDGDSVSDDSDDVTRFNDAFPSDTADPEYDPLADWDCNGFIDCDDRAQFLTNWPSASGVEDDSCP